VLNPKVLTYIPKEKLYHITELIVDAKKDGKKVGVYPIAEEAWNDIGQWAEYRQAVDRL
jgi:NDP-sugar pyrophosphorylase family protein